MKKIIVRIALAILILILLAVVGVKFFLNDAIKRAVETVGPRLTKTEVRLDSVRLSLLSGNGKIKGLMVGNPEGYQTPSAMRLGSGSLHIVPRSVLSGKVIVRSINLEGPEITFEGNLAGNNLKKILSNIEEASGGGTSKPPPTTAEGKKLQVDDFLVTGGQIHLHVSAAMVGGASGTVPLPEIRLSNLGQGPEGITIAELSEKVLRAILEKATAVAAKAALDLSKGATDAATKAGKDALENAGKKATEGINDLFKKKKE